MKRILGAALCCLLAGASASAQVPGEEPFHGGAADGHALAEDVTPLAPSLSFSPYFGGAGDGYAMVEDVTPLPPALSFSPYFGGAGDGYDGEDDGANTTLPFANNFSPFLGGAGGGYDAEDDPFNTVLPPAIAFGPYFGGMADGYAGLLVPAVIVLPAALLSFEGQAVERGHLLRWTTARDAHTESFLLERSADGASYTPLATVSANGTADRNAYSYTDAQPLAGRNFYRLKLVDGSGAQTHSHTVLLIRSEATAGPVLTLFPNPAGEALMLRYEALPEAAAMRVVDARGAVLWRGAAPAGAGNIALPVAAWTPGTYVLQLVTPGGWTESVLFVKQ